MEEKSSTEGLVATPPYLERLKDFVGEPSRDQIEVIKQLGGRDSIIMHNMPGTIAVHCVGILQRREPKNNVCLVIAPNHAYVHEILTTMKGLDKEKCVKVETCRTIISHYKSTSEILDVNVAVGIPYTAFDMVKVFHSNISMVFFYSGSEVIDDCVASAARIRLSNILKKMDNSKREVKVVFFSERALSKKSLDLFQSCFVNAKITPSAECVFRSLTVEGIQKHKYKMVTSEEDRVEKIWHVIEAIDSEAIDSGDRTIIYIDFCSGCFGRYENFCTKSCGLHRLLCFFNGRSMEKRKGYVEVFLGNTSLLIVPSRIRAGEIISSFTDKLHMIINYSSVDCCEYLQRLDPFKNVSTAITFATEADLMELYFLQTLCEFYFETHDELSKEVEKPEVILTAGTYLANDCEGEKHINKKQNIKLN